MEKLKALTAEYAPLLQFYALLGIFLLTFYSLLHIDFSEKYIAETYPAFTAGVVAGLLQTLGYEATSTGSLVNVGGFAFRIIYHCSAVFAGMIYAAAVIAYPATIREKAVGLAIGLPLLSAINTTRLVILGIIGKNYPDLFEYFHEYLWQGIFIIFVIILWKGWQMVFVEEELLPPDDTGAMTAGGSGPAGTA